VVVDFDVRCMNGTATPADGMGFALLNVVDHGTAGAITWAPAENPQVAGSLGIGFNVYNGNAGGTQVRVFFNNAQVGAEVTTSGAPLNAPLYKGTGKTSTEPYDHVRLEANMAAGTINLFMTISPSTIPVQVLSNFAVPGLAPCRWRLGFGARTGGANAIFDMDNVVARGLSSPVVTAAPVTIAEDGMANINITTTDPEDGPFT
jgi:hypothetical protein